MSRRRTRPLPDASLMRVLYNYDPETGELVHLLRPETSAANKRFNKRWAGQIAGTVMNVGYQFVQVGDQSLLGHRVAWAHHYGAWPEGEIDHRDGNKLNNSIRNLRLASRSQNLANRKGSAKSGLKGVYSYHPTVKGEPRWRSCIVADGVIHSLGNFYSPEAAHDAYVEAAARLHGEFAETRCLIAGSIRATVTIMAKAA